jgi:glutathione S-transferase
MAPATLTINSRNHGAWSLRGWLLCRMAGLEFVEEVGDPATRAELLLLSPSFLVPRLEHDGVAVWDALAIAEYLQERFPDAGLLPEEPVARAHCRSISAEVHGGFVDLRSALPMNMSARHPDFPVFSGARADIGRVTAIWRDCLGRSGGPFLFGAHPTTADAMFAPICSRFATYDITLDARCAAYRDAVLALPDVVEWAALAAAEPQDLVELEAEF